MQAVAADREIMTPGQVAGYLQVDLETVDRYIGKRTAAARTHEALAEAIRAALEAVTPGDARGYFTHAGYPPLAQAAGTPL